MDTPHKSSLLRRLARIGLRTVTWVALVGAGAWSTAAVYYSNLPTVWLRGLAAMVLDEARDDLLSAMADLRSTTKETAPVALRMLLSVSPARIPELRRRLLGLIKSLREECRAEGPGRKDAARWALTVAFAPRAKSNR